MYFVDFKDYIDSLDISLTKIAIEYEKNEAGQLMVITTKETYVVRDEEEADAIINNARQDAGFMEAKKKFKQGKINKNGEVTKPDTWTVVIKLGH